MRKIVLIMLIINCFFVGHACSAVEKGGAKKIILTTVDLETPYKILGDISVSKKNFLFPVSVTRMNDLLRRKAKEMYEAPDAIIEVRHDRIVIAEGIFDKEIGKTAKGIVVKFIQKRRIPPFKYTPDNDYEEMLIIGETAKNGIFDPSLEYNKTGTTGWMAYSAIEEPGLVHTHIAKSVDNGKTWTKITEVNTAYAGTIESPGHKSIKGIWRHEVPTLVNDHDDPEKPWKLFWHKYF